MIGYLRGIALSADCVDVAGVGYVVSCPRGLTAGQEAELWVTTVMREDSTTLYGFHDKGEQAVFTALLKVNGVGPRMALDIVGTLGVAGTVTAVRNSDVAVLRSVKGVGPKAASMILASAVMPQVAIQASEMESVADVVDPEAGAAIAALVSLGIVHAQARELVFPQADAGELLRSSLRRERPRS